MNKISVGRAAKLKIVKPHHNIYRTAVQFNESNLGKRKEPHS